MLFTTCSSLTQGSMYCQRYMKACLLNNSPRKLEVAQVHLQPWHIVIVEASGRQKSVKVHPLRAALPPKVIVAAHLQESTPTQVLTRDDAPVAA